MRQRSWLAVILLATGVAVLVVAGRAQAHGLGAHAAVGVGERSHQQVGFTWDTALASDRLLNFRLNLGYERFELRNEFGDEYDYKGVILEETLGVRLLANERLRLWAGPQLVTALYSGEAGAGWGVALGGNWHLEGVTSLGLTLSVRRMDYSSLVWGKDEKETVGSLQLLLMFRLPRDVYRREE